MSTISPGSCTNSKINVYIYYMPIKKSAKKQLRQGLKKKRGNDAKKKETKELLKKLSVLIEQGKKQEAEQMLPRVYKSIDKMAKAGLLKKNTAARKKSVFTKRTNRSLNVKN